ncbi:MAG: hypothetical protein JWR49_3846 [Tardiphaga sp.]|nr:hypothetical protein [Tardiphaga sp.]
MAPKRGHFISGISFRRPPGGLLHHERDLSWDLLILKILASRPNGEATTTEIARDLAILSSISRGIPSIDGGIFGTGLVVSARKGAWRITDNGREYLAALSFGRHKTEANVGGESSHPDDDFLGPSQPDRA